MQRVILIGVLAVYMGCGTIEQPQTIRTDAKRVDGPFRPSQQHPAPTDHDDDLPSDVELPQDDVRLLQYVDGGFALQPVVFQ